MYELDETHNHILKSKKMSHSIWQKFHFCVVFDCQQSYFLTFMVSLTTKIEKLVLHLK